MMLTSRLPHAPTGGDRLRSKNILLSLASAHDVHLVSLVDSPPTQKDIDFLTANTRSYRLFPRSKVQSGLGAVRQALIGNPLQVGYYFDPAVQAYVDELLPSMDAAVPVLVRMARYVMGRKIPVMLDMTDAISYTYERAKRTAASPIWKAIYAFEAPRLRKFEERCVKEFGQTLLVNENEVDLYRSSRVSWLTQGVDSNLLAYDPGMPQRQTEVGFIGKLDYRPNIEAVNWFVEKVLPLLPETTIFRVFGSAPTAQILSIAKRNHRVDVPGFLPDAHAELAKCGCVVAPMISGGGIQTKILEGMAMGSVVVCTPHAAKAITGAEHGKHLFAEPSPEAMAIRISQVLMHPERVASVRTAAQRLMRENYSWEGLKPKFLERLEVTLRAFSSETLQPST